MDHNEYENPDCGQQAEDHIVRDVYGCDAGRNCAQVTLEQRIAFEKQIAKRLAGLLPEGT